jgi:hypothetical protein
MVAAKAPQQKSAPKMKPGAGGLKANTRNDVSKTAYGKNPPKRPGLSGDRPRPKGSPLVARSK